MPISHFHTGTKAQDPSPTPERKPVASKYKGPTVDGVRLSPLQGAAYDQTASESRLIFGDYTSGTFGNNFDVTIDYIRFDLAGAYLPSGADADADGIPDSWEYRYYGNLTAASASGDDDADGLSNLAEYVANTHPRDAASVFKASAIERQGGGVSGQPAEFRATELYPLAVPGPGSRRGLEPDCRADGGSGWNLGAHG